MNVYLDNAASTKMDDRVFEEMVPFLKDRFGNPSSVHMQGKFLKVVLEEARETVADFLYVKPKNIFFTSGGTEANNFAIKGLALANNEKNKNHIITSTIEHPAVIDAVMYLKKFGYRVSLLTPDSNGFINPDDISKEISAETLLVTIMHVNNELGTINDAETIGEICRNNNVFFHSDTVQSIGKTHLNPPEMGMDFATCSAHKIYGPKGVGFLYAGSDIKIDKFMHGGGQERDMRGGTENIAGIIGLKKAIELLKTENDMNHYAALRDYLKKRLAEEFKDCTEINSDGQKTVPNIMNVSFIPGKLHIPDSLLPVLLDLKGISVSGGSACTSGSLKPSRVLLEIGKNERDALASVRISFGRFNTTGDLDALIKALKEIFRV